MNWQSIRHFKAEEFKCPCCDQEQMVLAFVLSLDRAREAMAVPFKVNSGYRCVAHNKRVGGAANSPHLIGWAADLALHGEAALTLTRMFTGVGLKQHGDLDRRYIHVDGAPNLAGVRPRPWVWTYG